jgi:hypothetical protein
VTPSSLPLLSRSSLFHSRIGRRRTAEEYNRTAEENGWVLWAYAEEDSIQLTKDEPAKRYKKNQQNALDQWIIARLFGCSANCRASLRLESGGQEDALLLGLLYLGVADDLCTQYPSRQL